MLFYYVWTQLQAQWMCERYMALPYSLCICILMYMVLPCSGIPQALEPIKHVIVVIIPSHGQSAKSKQSLTSDQIPTKYCPSTIWSREMISSMLKDRRVRMMSISLQITLHARWYQRRVWVRESFTVEYRDSVIIIKDGKSHLLNMIVK